MFEGTLVTTMSLSSLSRMYVSLCPLNGSIKDKGSCNPVIMIKLSILSHFRPRKIFVIIFVMGGDESVDHRASAYSATALE